MNWIEQFFIMGGGPSVVIPLLVPILLLLAAWQDRRRPRPGHCRRCGYNLTGNTSGICPECGEPATSRDNSPEEK